MKRRKNNTATPQPPATWNDNDQLTADQVYAIIEVIRRIGAKPSEAFLPYFKRAVLGKDNALVEFYREVISPFEAAFYAFIGYLVVNGAARGLSIAQKLNRALPWTGKKLRTDSYEGWKARLTPLAQAAASWIKRKRGGGEHEFTRTRLWRDYVEESPEVRHIGPERKDVLLQGVWTGESNRNKPVSPEQYLWLGLIPKQLFFLLAQTKPAKLAVSVAVRRYMAGAPLKLPWSSATHKGLTAGSILRKN